MKKTIAILLALLLAIGGVIGSAAPSHASSQKLEVTSTALNYRNAPWGTVLGTLSKGQTFDVLGSRRDNSSDLWYQISRGWVHGDYVKVSGTPAPAKPLGKLTVTSANLNVRNDVWGTWIGEVKSGASIDYFATRKDSSGKDWYQITFGSGKGWVHGDYIKLSTTAPAPTPTPTPAPAPTGQKGEVINTNSLNVRSGVWGSWIGSVSRGDTFDLRASRKDSSGDTWYQIPFGSGTGWVHGDYLKVTSTSPSTPAPKPTGQTGVVINTSVLNVRSGVWGSWIGTVNGGQSFALQDSRKDSSGDTWYQIPFGSGTGWVHGRYLQISSAPTTPPSTSTSYGTVLSNVLNVRNDVWGNWVGEVHKDASFELHASKKDSSGDTWYQITYSATSKGWVHGNYLKVETLSAPPVIPRTVTLSVSANTPHYEGSDLTLSARQTGHVNPQYRFSVFDGGSWRVIKDFSTGGSAIATPKAGTIQYKVDVRSAGQTQLTSATTTTQVLPRNVTAVDVILTSMEFSEGMPLMILASAHGSPEPLYEISLNTGSGWRVLKSYSASNSATFTPEKEGTVTIRVRAKDKLSTNDNEAVFEQKAQLKKGLTPHSYVNTYYGSLEEFARAQLGGAQISSGRNWVNATYEQILRELDPRVILSGDYQSEHPGVEAVIAKSTSGGGVNLRGDMWGEVIVTVPDRTRLALLGTGHDENNELWYNVRYNDQDVWIKASVATLDLEVTKSDSVTLGNFAMINTTSLNLRSGPGTSYEALRQVTRGNIYSVLEENGSWLKIKADSVEGWIHKGYVVLTDRVNQGMYQFLDLRGTTEVTAAEINKVLRGKGILDGLGASFVEAAELYGINEMYLIAHALLETGNGSSTLAKGRDYTGPDGKTVKVYNMYGIGAYDSDPIGLGTRTAYNLGWTTPHRAIVGGAEWIASRYVNNRYSQNTLYKMRWNYDNVSHQYATDVGWARKQVSTISSLYNQVQGYKMRFEIPVYIY